MELDIAFAKGFASLLPDGNLSEFSRRSGIGASTLSGYEKGALPRMDKLVQIARTANVSIEWLATGEGTREIASDARKTSPAPDTTQSMAPLRLSDVATVPEGFVAVPQLDIRASAGLGRASLPAEAVATSHFLFREQWLRSLGIAPQNAEFVLAEGDSMEPTIRDGDMMLLDRGFGRVVNGKIYVLVVNDLVMVKRVHVLAGAGLMLIPDNDRYPSETIAHNDIRHLQIEARVAWFGRVI